MCYSSKGVIYWKKRKGGYSQLLNYSSHILSPIKTGNLHMLMNYWITFKSSMQLETYLQPTTNTSIQNSINEERKKQNSLNNPQKKPPAKY